MTPNSGPPGTAINLTVINGAGYTGVYTLNFNDAGDVTLAKPCHHSTTFIGQGAATVDGKGINQVGAAAIPSGASQGKAELCYAQSKIGQYSPSVTFTVT